MWRHLHAAVRDWLLIRKRVHLSSIFSTVTRVVAPFVCSVTSMSSETTIRVRHLNGAEYPTQISLDVRYIELPVDGRFAVILLNRSCI